MGEVSTVRSIKSRAGGGGRREEGGRGKGRKRERFECERDKRGEEEVKLKEGGWCASWREAEVYLFSVSKVTKPEE